MSPTDNGLTQAKPFSTGVPMYPSLLKVTLLAIAMVTGVIAYAAGDAEAGQSKAATCVACHGVDGNSAVPTFPKLAGLGHNYLLKQMQDIRDGRRPVALMAGQVDNMTDQDLSDIAAFYDAQPRTGGIADPEKVALGRKGLPCRHRRATGAGMFGLPQSDRQWQRPGWVPRAGRSARGLYSVAVEDVPKGLRRPDGSYQWR